MSRSVAAMSLRAVARPKRVPGDARALTPRQASWLGALLLAAQLPHIAIVPLWIAILGVLLVLVRLMLIRGDADGKHAPRTGSIVLVLLALVAGIAIRVSFGYFLGRDPCVAFLFILVGIKFLEARSTRDGTVLLCLAAFLFVTPFFYSQSLFAALAAAPSVLLAGATLDVLARPPQPAMAEENWMQPLRRSARLMLHGIPLAAILFVLFPRLAVPLWGLPTDRSSTTGLSDTMKPGSISELSLSDAVAFRVDFDDVIPPAPLRYWRGPVLTRFDGREWSVQPQRVESNPLRLESKPISYTVTMEPNYKPWLFALELPASLPRTSVDTDTGEAVGEIAGITRDQQLIGRSIVLQTLRYRQTSQLRSRYPADSALDAAENLRLSTSGHTNNPKTIEFIRDLRARNPDDATFIRAVLRWFREEPFVYTLSPPELEHDPVDGFLFETRRGFCEHYAGAFVFMLRAAGIPARVVTGYQGGEMNPRGGYMIVRQSDAHAWAEAIVGGQWTRFDPTAAVSPSRIELGLGASMPLSEPVPLLARLDVGWIKGAQLMWDAVNHDWRRHIVGFDYRSQRSLWRDWRVDHLAAWQFTAIVVAFGLAWVCALLGWLAWRRRKHDRVRAAWNAACVRLARAGLPRQPYEGPLAYAQRAAARWPQYAAPFAAMAEAYAALRYGVEAEQPDTHKRRAAMMGQLRRAIDLLPASHTLRALHSR